jgi:hypothetical protein
MYIITYNFTNVRIIVLSSNDDLTNVRILGAHHPLS